MMEAIKMVVCKITIRGNPGSLWKAFRDAFNYIARNRV